MVHIEPLPDDFRGCPIDWNLRQTLHIPDSAKEPSRLGRVMALGSNRWVPGEMWSVKQPDGSRKWEWQPGYYEPFSVKVGDIVLCTRYPKSAENLYWDGKRVFIMDEREILAKVEVSNGATS